MSPLPSIPYGQIARKSKRFSVTSGPWVRVNDSWDPGEVRLNELFDAENIVIPDPVHGSGAYSRLGFPGLFASLGGAAGSSTNQLGTGGGSPNRDGQGVYDHTDLDGTIRRFFFVGNKVYRWDGDTSLSGTLTDVTPVGVTINPGTTNPRVYCASLAGKLIVSDGVNRPWVGTNLGTAPITGTYIDYDGAAGAWTAFGRPTVFGGSVVFIANSLAGVASRDVLLWSAPADPTVGYKQTNYANFWELFQTATDPLYAIQGTNAALYYWRRNSIGAIPGPTLNVAKAAATHDSVSGTVGCTAPATVVFANDVIFFADSIGRPYRLPVGGTPEDLSWQLRREMARSTISLDATLTQRLAWAAYIPDVELVGFAIWGLTTALGGNDYTQTLYVFSATTGNYVGRWLFTGSVTTNQTVFLDIGGVLRDSVGNRRLYLIGTDGAATRTTAHAGFVYEQQLQGRSSSGSLTVLYSQYQDGYIGDGSPSGIDVRATIWTHALAYSDEQDRFFDRVVVSTPTAFTGVDEPVGLYYATSRVDYQGSALVAYAKGMPDLTRGVSHAVFGIQAGGRYLRAKVQIPAPGLGSATWGLTPHAIGSIRVEGFGVGPSTPAAP